MRACHEIPGATHDSFAVQYLKNGEQSTPCRASIARRFPLVRDPPQLGHDRIRCYSAATVVNFFSRYAWLRGDPDGKRRKRNRAVGSIVILSWKTSSDALVFASL